jgi:four helix bundle protein
MKAEERTKEGIMQGHKKMIIWGNIELVEKMVFNRILMRIPVKYFKIRDQIERATTSISANFVEGYYSGSIKEYLKFLGYSRRSLAELNNWGRQVQSMKLLDIDIYREFDDLTIRTQYLFNRLIYSLQRKI